MKDKYDYAYAVGRVRALETRIIPKEIFLQAIEAGSVSEAINIFYEFTHNEAIKAIRDSEDLESFLTEQNSRLKEEITKLLDDTQLIEALFNLNEDLETSRLNIYRKPALPFLTRIYEHLSNLGALTNYLRLNLTDKISEFYLGDYANIARPALRVKQKEDSYLFLERSKQDSLLGLLSSARYIAFGPEPIINYYFLQLNQMRLLRWVILGKLNQVPKEILLKLI